MPVARAPTALPLACQEQWHSAVTDTFCAMEISYGDRSEFRGELLNTPLNRIQLARVGSSAIKVNRQRRHIGQQEQPHYLVKFQLAGSGLVEQRGQRALLQPGDFVICSSSEPYKLHFEQYYRQAVIAVPQPLLADMYQPIDQIIGQRMGYELATNSLLSQFVASVMGRIDELDPQVVMRLEANIIDLLGTSLGAAASTPATRTGKADSGRQHLESVKRLIALNLANPNLNTDFIAEAEGISKRYLHLLFSDQETTLSRYIQRQRLDACRSALGNPESDLTTTEIALEWGFSDVSHFHRCFKAAYGVTPRQYKLEAQQRPAR